MADLIFLFCPEDKRNLLDGMVRRITPSEGAIELEHASTTSSAVARIKISKPSCVFVLMDRSGNGEGKEGTHFIRELLRTLKGLEVPAIVLMSVLDRNDLWTNTLGTDKFLLKSFPFIRIPGQPMASRPRMSLSKWRYLRMYALTSSGILDKLLHDVRNAIRAGANDRALMDAVVQQLQGLPDLTDGSIRALLAEYGPELHDEALMKWTAHLLGAIERRVVALEPDRLLNRTRQVGTRRPLLMLVEDDATTAEALKVRFEEYFQVAVFRDGPEALRELEVGGRFYHALVSDLELLEENGRFDQSVQGIEVLEYAREQHPHIARRVITSLGRRGVRELLPDLRMEDILFKAQLAQQGPDGLFLEFVEKLLGDVDDLRSLQDMHGPDSTLWADVSKERNQADNKGGGFKRFYYQLKVEDPGRFGKMWSTIRETAERIRANDPTLKMDASFINPGRARNLLETKDWEYNIRFLTKLLLHRMVMMLRYFNGEEVRYQDDDDKGRSYVHWGGWKKRPVQNPRQYRYFTGFGAEWQKPSEPREDDRRIVFKLEYGPLFPEEVELIRSFDDLHAGRLSEFFMRHGEFCSLLNEILGTIQECVAESGKKVFENTYPTPMDNPESMENRFAASVIETLSREESSRQGSQVKGSIRDKLTLFRDGPLDVEEDQDGTPAFNALPLEMQHWLDESLRVL